MKTVVRILAILVLLAALGGLVFYLHPLWVADQQLHFRMWREGLQSHYVNVPAGRIHYYEAPAAQGSANTPLLLIHGLGARGEEWANLMPGLAAQGFHVYAPDLLGYGRSAKSPNGDYSIPNEEAVVLQFMQAMHLDRADVGGWSMGGWVAMKLTLDHPERVDRLVVYDSAGITFVPDFKKELFTPGDAAGLDLLEEKLYPHPQKLPGFVVRDVLRKIASFHDIVTYSMTDMLTGHDLLDNKLQQMSRPMLIVWGTEDRLIPLSVGEDIHRRTPGSMLETVPGCGHMAPTECAGPVLADTVSFLRDAKP